MERILHTSRFWTLLAVVGSALLGFAAMFARLRGAFNDPLEDLSHGWLILPFSLYVLWTDREQIRRSAGAPSWAGLLACLPCVTLALLGTRGLQLRFEQLGFIGLCMALPWAFFGRRTASRFIFPALFLLFTVPLASFLDVVTIHLRLLASGLALGVLRGLGINAMQQGTAVFAQGAHSFYIDVAEPCSGLRSLFALMALTAAYSWFTQPTWLRRCALFACSVPLAVAGNVMRIISICLVGVWGSSDFAMGFYHDYSGYVVFVVAIALMVVAGEVVTKLAERRGGGKATAEPAPEPWNGMGAARLVPWVAAAVLVPVFLFQASTTDPVLTEPPEIDLPTELPGTRSEEVRFCQNEQCMTMFPASRLEKGDKVCPICGGALKMTALSENTVLPEDTRFARRLYHGASGTRYLVTAVIGGRSKSSLHRPELCMPAQGYTMRSPCDFEVSGRPFHAIRLESPRAYDRMHVYTFVNQTGMRTARHVRRILTDIWDRSVHNRIDRWVMFTIAASADGRAFTMADGEDRVALESFLGELFKELP